MGNSLAQTFFATGPDNSVAAVDVYQSNGQSVVNSIQPVASKSTLDLGLSMGGTSLSNVFLTKPPRLGNSSIGDPTDRMMCSITDSEPSFTSSLKSAYRSIDTKSALNIAQGFKSGRGLSANIGGSTFNLKGANYGAANSIGQFMNVMTNNPQFFKLTDRDGKASLLGGVIREGTRLGIPNLIGTLGQNNLDRRTKQNILLSALPNIVQSGKTLFMKDASGLSTASSIPRMYPSYTRDFGRNYSPPTNVFSNPDKEFTDFMGAADLIKPGWDRKMIGNTNALDMTQIMGGNSDFKRMISVGSAALPVNDDRKMLGMCKIYDQPQDVMSSLKYSFPKTSLLSSSQQRVFSAPRSADPRTDQSLSSIPSFDYAGPDNAENPDSNIG
jgi:hypothetical protein